MIYGFHIHVYTHEHTHTYAYIFDKITMMRHLAGKIVPYTLKQVSSMFIGAEKMQTLKAHSLGRGRESAL